MAGETSGKAKSDVLIALLRGINVGGRHRLPMSGLVAVFKDAGCRSVQTYIQSGNVIFEAKPALARRIPGLIAKAISGRFGFDVPVVVRTSQELNGIVRSNPFLGADVDQKTLHVAFLADLPGPDRVAALDPHRSPPDEFAVQGREIYLRCPNGLARTKLSNAYFDSKLATVSTLRNWKTVLKLHELSR